VAAPPAPLTSGAAFLSDSYRNMERIGMRLMFMRAVWTPLAETAQAPR
jgi:hypothetical protein